MKTALMTLLILAGLLPGSQVYAASAKPEIRISIEDLTPRFLDFYDHATKENADPDRRWALWKQFDGFTTRSVSELEQAVLREQIENAWSRYPDVIDRIRSGFDGMQPSPTETLNGVTRLLILDRSMDLTLQSYVGTFSDESTTRSDAAGKLVVSLPVEDTPLRRSLASTRELARAVHITVSGLPINSPRSIAEIVMQEGIAAHTVKTLVPGKADETYLGADLAWLKEANTKRHEIIKGIRAVLDDRHAESVVKFTSGQGNTGIDREANYVGWLVVGSLLNKGYTLADLAHISPKEMPHIIKETTARLQKPKSQSGTNTL